MEIVNTFLSSGIKNLNKEFDALEQVLTLVHPFDSTVWTILCMSFLIFIATTSMIDLFQIRINHDLRKLMFIREKERGLSYVLSNRFWYFYDSLLRQRK